MEKPTIIFKSRFENGMHYILSACPEADALFELLRRSYLSENEMPWVGKMGFNVVICGDTKQLGRELRKRDIEFKLSNGRIEYER